jgi:hypothetical protein
VRHRDSGAFHGDRAIRFPGAIMGLSYFVIAFWNHDPLLAILSTSAAILLFAASIERGIESLRADPAKRILLVQQHCPRWIH